MMSSSSLSIRKNICVNYLVTSSILMSLQDSPKYSFIVSSTRKMLRNCISDPSTFQHCYRMKMKLYQKYIDVLLFSYVSLNICCGSCFYLLNIFNRPSLLMITLAILSME